MAKIWSPVSSSIYVSRWWIGVSGWPESELIFSVDLDIESTILWLIDSDCLSATNDWLCLTESAAELTTDKLCELWMSFWLVPVLVFEPVAEVEPWWLSALAWLPLLVLCFVTDLDWWLVESFWLSAWLCCWLLALDAFLVSVLVACCLAFSLACLAWLAACWLLLWLAFCWLAACEAFKDALKLAEAALLADWLALACVFWFAVEAEFVTLLCVELTFCEFVLLVEPGIVALVLVARRFLDLLRSRFAPLGVSSALAIVVDPAPKSPATIPIPAKNHCLPLLYIL